ncbi:MAG: VanZ family protein [Lawsonibacter sp.]|jgi:glycopeptide antibiotics resistance protein
MFPILLEAAGDIWRYVLQMIPCMLVALFGFVLIYPLRQKRLARLGLFSSPLREIGLLIFVLFFAGLTALTLFPNNLWVYIMQPNRYPEGVTFWSFYPTSQQILQQLETLLDQLSKILKPFPYGLEWHFRSYWFAFLFFGNIVMFLPIGFFPALLWRGVSWWKALLTGIFLSLFIETVQFFINRGTDLDDLILNSVGAFLGYICYRIIHFLAPTITSRFQCISRRETESDGRPCGN